MLMEGMGIEKDSNWGWEILCIALLHLAPYWHMLYISKYTISVCFSSQSLIRWTDYGDMTDQEAKRERKRPAKHRPDPPEWEL